MENLTRRRVIGVGVQGAAMLSLVSVQAAMAAPDETGKYIADFTGGKEAKAGRVKSYHPGACRERQYGPAVGRGG